MILFFGEQFQVHSKLDQKAEVSHVPPAPTDAQPPSLSTPRTSMEHLLQCVNLH